MAETGDFCGCIPGAIRPAGWQCASVLLLRASLPALSGPLPDVWRSGWSLCTGKASTAALAGHATFGLSAALVAGLTTLRIAVATSHFHGPRRRMAGTQQLSCIDREPDMTPEERRQEVARLLADDPTLSQWAIAKLIGVSQKTISRDMAALGLVSANQFVTNRPTTARPQPVSVQVNGGMSRGDSLVARLRDEMAEQNLIPTSVEEEHLATAKDLADRIELLQGMVARDGESRKLKDGRVALHPALAEIRQCESVLTRVVGGISTMEDVPKNPKKVKAANTRWRTTQLAAVQRDRRAADPYGS